MLNHRRHENRRPARDARPGAGFSLIELMVTMTILGFLLVATIPSIGTWLRNTEIRNAAESINNGLAKARSEAVRRNQPVFFSLVTPQSGNPGVLDNSCALSATSASWIVSMETPQGKCVADVSEDATPKIVAKYAQGDGARNVAITIKDADCAAAASTTQVSYNSFGRIATPATAIRCIDIRHTASGTSRPLRLMLGNGGNVRMCDPAVSDDNDPRKC
jgi:type IV fimbrial biogenesis protein FimT